MLSFKEHKIFKFIMKYKFVAIIILAGILLILLPDFSTSDKKNSIESDLTETQRFEYSVLELEQKLENILEKSDGVGRVSVVLTVKSDVETVFQKDVDSSVKNTGNQEEVTQSVTQKTVIISAGSGTQEPLIIKKIYPEFCGAAVVCDGADNAKVRLNVTQAVSALTGLSSEKITVTKMKN